MSKCHEDSGFSKLSNTCIICNQLVYGYKALEKHLLSVHAEESGQPIDVEHSLVEDALKKANATAATFKTAVAADFSAVFQGEDELYHCPKCPKTHTDIKALRTHIKTHINMNLECGVCQKMFKNPTLLKQHVQRHRTDAVYNCDVCDKKFMTLQKLNKHRKVHRQGQSFTCDLCGMSFTQNEYLQKHLKCHTDIRPHVCTICKKTFRTKPELRVHAVVHTRETPYTCQHCGRGFSQKGNYRIHLAQHTGQKPYQCSQCPLSFALRCHLTRHEATHNQKINYRCIWCSKECTLRKHMQMHVARVHKEDFFQFEEQMKLASPMPIAASQKKLYNRKVASTGKVRKPYKVRHDVIKHDETALCLMQYTTGTAFKELHFQDPSGSEAQVMEVVQPDTEILMDTSMIPTLTETPKDTHENLDRNLEILVSDEHQNYLKHKVVSSAPELLTCQDQGPEPTAQTEQHNLEIVFGDNNEINIIIQDPRVLTNLVGDSSLVAFHEDGLDSIQTSLPSTMGVLISPKEDS